MSIEEYLDHFNKIILDLENIDITVSDEDKAIASYINMKEAIMYGRDSLTFDEVQSILHARELQKQEESKEESGDGLNIRGRSEKEEKKDKNSKSRSKSKTKKFKCFICHKEGHFKKDCPDKRQNTVKKTMNEGDVAVILDGYDNVELLNVAEVDSSKEWILDSRSSFHMIKHYDGIERVLEDVRSIPELKRNLISLGMLDKSGYTFKSEPNSLRVVRGSLVVMKWTIKNGLYTFTGQTVTNKVSIVLKEDVGITKLWHQRLGHISHRGLQELEKQGVLGNYKLTDLPFCEHSEEIVDMEPKTYQEAINSNETDQWVKVVQEEMDSLRKNETWELVTKPKDRKLVGSKWVFKRKQGTLGDDAPRYKARLVAKGFSQKEAHEDLELDQLDVKTAFLHGELDELIYMQPPEGFGEGIKDGQVCLLKKSFYGLKQSPRQWYKRLDKYMLDIGFNRSSHDGCVYFKLNEDIMVYLLLYVDDMRVACQERRHLEQVKEMLKAKFEMKDLGSAKRILGMEIERDRSKRVLRLSQKSYIKLQGFVDVDYAGNIDTRKSLTGYVFTVFGGAVSWKANLQSVVALSTTEVEYMAMIEAVKEAI
ncbi:Retrovirus-related Pol polyprotein from transposon TNT 1-94 [Vitis vinifera]|uniref:Retrovirus-related Pol polyprotein from transposon TNT 1-94 n=1 Tax=Vitis vinifera TaxID=29760 RepID=A0A438GCG9_VITVI|nr:Retrovirus-related Pol polyprotein from transposon TNT 1-94 [Vitis vinifera]